MSSDFIEKIIYDTDNFDVEKIIKDDLRFAIKNDRLCKNVAVNTAGDSYMFRL